jgi:hypothetical protein
MNCHISSNYQNSSNGTGKFCGVSVRYCKSRFRARSPWHAHLRTPALRTPCQILRAASAILTWLYGAVFAVSFARAFVRCFGLRERRSEVRHRVQSHSNDFGTVCLQMPMRLRQGSRHGSSQGKHVKAWTSRTDVGRIRKWRASTMPKKAAVETYIRWIRMQRHDCSKCDC